MTEDKMRKKVYLLCCLLLIPVIGLSNNVQIDGVILTGQNTNEGYTLVQFDLSWENSWRTSSAPNNWDAAWVFVKYKVGGGDWQPAKLHNSGHSTGTGTPATVEVGLPDENSAFNANSNPGVKAFFYRSEDGSGTFDISNAQLRWNYAENSVTDDALVTVRVFAIEMVYVAPGEFYVGDGGSCTGRFKAGNTENDPFLITGAWDKSIGDESGKLWGVSTSGSSTIGGAGTLHADYPTGLDGFYCMKYEITQQQYVDYLNTLTEAQANTSKYTNSTYRYAITGNEVGEYATALPNVPCNWFDWARGAFYTSWAGLRPMTELEYEKACRGPLYPVADEYAWGDTTITQTTGMANEGADNEIPSNTGANAVYNRYGGIQGPIRVGAFATSTSAREEAGASYWGIMELSGNLWERPITVGNASGRAFTGLHGSGYFGITTGWPGTNAEGTCFRGGSWYGTTSSSLCVSMREYGSLTNNQYKEHHGFRAVRSLPTTSMK